MKIDITLPITNEMARDANDHLKLAGHVGTHFDVINKTFPLDYTERKGMVFDVHAIKDRDIDNSDIDMNLVEEGMFVLFYTGFIEETPYGTTTYFKEHPQLSDELIQALTAKQISIIGIDFAGVRRGKEHTPTDQYCADRNVFIIENLCNVAEVLQHGNHFLAHTYPMSYVGVTGLPCRVIAEIE